MQLRDIISLILYISIIYITNDGDNLSYRFLEKTFCRPFFLINGHI